MLESFKSVLVLAPHTDDGELGAGATIAKLVELGAVVHYVAFSSAAESVPEGFPKDVLKTEVKAATKSLGILPDNLTVLNYRVRRLNYSRQDILEDLIQLRRENKYDLVLTPSLNDVHQDHNAVSLEAVRAFKNTSILGYELIWNNLSFSTTCFNKVEERHINTKVEALSMYTSQHGRDYMSKDFVYSLAHARGVQVGCKYAESFEVIRLFL